MWDMSDKSDELCERIIKTELHVDMLEKLKWKTLSADILNDPRWSMKRYFVNAHLATIHNVVRRATTARAAFRQHRAVDVVHKFRFVSEDPVNFVLFLFYL